MVSASAAPSWMAATLPSAPMMTELVIAPEAVDPGEVEMLQDMVLSAANEALRQAEEAMNKAVSGASGGLNLGF